MCGGSTFFGSFRGDFWGVLEVFGGGGGFQGVPEVFSGVQGVQARLRS